MAPQKSPAVAMDSKVPDSLVSVSIRSDFGEKPVLFGSEKAQPQPETFPCHTYNKRIGYHVEKVDIRHFGLLIRNKESLTRINEHIYVSFIFYSILVYLALSFLPLRVLFPQNAPYDVAFAVVCGQQVSQHACSPKRAVRGP